MASISSVERRLLDEAINAVETKRDLLGDAVADQVEIETERLLIGIELDSAACAKLLQTLKDVMQTVAPITTRDDLFAALPEIKQMVNKGAGYYGLAVTFADNGFMYVSFPGGNSYYDITYSTAYGTAPAKKIASASYGESYTLTDSDIPTLTADGYTHTGWSLNGAAVSVGTEVSRDVTLVAEWGVNAPTTVDYTISYSTAYGTAPASKTVTVNAGESYALTADDLPIITADGYVFGGWTLGGVIASVGDTISANATLVAVWEKADAEFDWDSFIQGYRVGAALRRKRVLPVAYLYNGVRLPKLPEWDKEAYPYAVIRNFTNTTVTHGECVELYCSSSEMYRTNGTMVGYMNILAPYCKYTALTADGSVAEYTEDAVSWRYDGVYTEDCSEQDYASIAWSWANHTIYYPSGNIRLEASEPVPVYE